MGVPTELMALPGTLVAGRYQLDEPIGSGGYSEVWRATDAVLARPVAVKLLHPGYAHQPEALARFQAEARHGAALWHENIAHIYDYDETDDGVQPYLVMELVDGPSLAGVLANGPLDAARTMDIVAQTAAGLQSVHARGLIHRDIKPGNILLTSNGTVKITDFGISHAIGSVPVTVTGIVMGSAGYLAPERIAGAQAAPASDLYALGVVAYECLAGAPPFTGKPLDVACAHRERSVPPLPVSVPTGVNALVMELVAKDPAWRPGSSAEVALRAGRLRDDLRGGCRVGAGRRRSPVGYLAAVPPPRRPIAPAAFAADARRRILAASSPSSRARTGTRRLGRPVLVLASLAIAVLIGISLVVTFGAVSLQHPVGALPSTPPRHSVGRTAVPSAHKQSPAGPSHMVGPDTSHGDRGTVQTFARNHHERGNGRISRPRDGGSGDRGQGSGGSQGNGNGDGNGNGNGTGSGNGNGNGNGNWNGQDQGSVNAQLLSFSSQLSQGFSSRLCQGVRTDAELLTGQAARATARCRAGRSARPLCRAVWPAWQRAPRPER